MTNSSPEIYLKNANPNAAKAAIGVKPVSKLYHPLPVEFPLP